MTTADEEAAGRSAVRTEGAGACPTAPIRARDVLAAELTKIRTLPATWCALALCGGADILLAILAATDAVRIAGAGGAVPIAQHGAVVLAPGYAFAAIAVFAAGSEYRGGQLRISLTAVPDRHRLFAAKLLAGGLLVVAAIPAVLPGRLIRLAAADPTDRGIDEAAGGLATLLTGYLLLSLIGYGFAFVARTVVVPLAVLVGTPVLISPILHRVLPGAADLLPHEAALALLDMPADAALGRWQGLLVLTAWAATSLACAWAAVVRRDG